MKYDWESIVAIAAMIVLVRAADRMDEIVELFANLKNTFGRQSIPRPATSAIRAMERC